MGRIVYRFLNESSGKEQIFPILCFRTKGGIIVKHKKIGLCCPAADFMQEGRLLMTKKEKSDTYAFDRRVYHLLQPAVRFFMQKKYRFHGEKILPKERPCLVYVNHQGGAMDPVLLAAAFPRHMYFVASEHVLRHRGSAIFMHLTHPILRVKGKTDSASALAILRQLQKGRSVCVFIEGERTWDGCTMDIPQSSAHLAKLAGCSLLTYTLHGAYLAHPRWSKELRKGDIRGELVHEYSPAEIKGMSQEELLSAIRADLFVDTYAEQAEEKKLYPAKYPAEDLETALFLCPRCGRIGALRSRWEFFECQCGLKTSLDAYGFFQTTEGQAPPFPHVHAWFQWQKQQISRLIRDRMEEKGPLLQDNRQYLYLCLGLNKDRLLAKGTLSLSLDKLEFQGENGYTLSLRLNELSDLACEEQMLLSFVHQGKIYEIRSLHPRSAIKYQLFFRELKQLSKRSDSAGEKLAKK